MSPPIRVERLVDVIKAAAGKDVDHIARLTPRQVVPAGIIESLQKIYARRAWSIPKRCPVMTIGQRDADHC